MVVSLGTRWFREAEHRAALLDREFDGALARARAAMSEAEGKADFNAILRRYLREVLDGDGAGRAPLSLMPMPVLEHQLGQARDALAKRDIGRAIADLDRLAQDHGITGVDRFTLGVGVLEARVQALEAAIRQAKGEAAAVFTAPEEPGRPDAPPPPSTDRRAAEAPAKTAPVASALIEPFFVRRETIDRLSHHDMSQERTTLRLFLDVCGDRAISEYSRGDVTGFLNTLRRLPRPYGKSPKDRDRTVAEIIAAASADAPRLSDKTVKRHHTALTQFFRFAMDGGDLSVAQHTELTAKHRFREDQKARDQRDAWTSDDLRTLFRSPVWTGCHRFFRSQPGDQIIRDAKFWLPILALYHGARLEEFADLYRRDIWCDGGTWAIRIVRSDDNGEAGTRTVKTDAAVRVIPVHPEMIRLGFLAYVRRTAPAPDDPLFPDLKPQGKDRKRGPRITRWFREYREAIGVYREGIGMHAFRHTAITRLSDQIVTWQDKRRRDYIMGHATGAGTEGDLRYDKGAGLKACAEALARLTYPEVDLSHLYVEENAGG